jgi:AcrR family transcriptional regulator
MTDSETLWRGTSSDDRVDERRARMLRACFDIVGQHGASALAVRAVCRAASISPRHFYESFTDVDALLLAAYELAVQQLADVLAAATTREHETPPWPRLSERERLQIVFETTAGYLENHPHASRIIFREALTNNSLRTHATHTLTAFMHAVRQAVVDDADRPARRNRHLEATLLSGGLATVFIEWLSGSSQFTRRELVDYCTDASLAVLSMRPPVL